MKDQIKFRLLGSLLGVCLISLAVLSYYIYDLKHNEELQNPYISPLSPQTIPSPWPKGWYPLHDPWDNSDAFSNMQKRMDAMMSRMLPGGSIFSQQGFGLFMSSPEVIMTETNNAYNIDISVLEGQDIELNAELESGILTVSGKVKNSSENNDDYIQGKSVSISQFSQSLVLSEPINEGGMTIENRDTGMQIRVPKAPLRVN